MSCLQRVYASVLLGWILLLTSLPVFGVEVIELWPGEVPASEGSKVEPIYDQVSARPDFMVLIYPAFLNQGEGNTLSDELVVNTETPPCFLFVAADDKHVNSSYVMARALADLGVPYELHVFLDGGHGYGMRDGNRAAETWPRLCLDWLNDFALGKR
ncbi:prolyl oligopeptidase family serine peptidase [Coraliomargarita algicola]|uniref:Prolyl oligopeptidase family serine peptidase n=1 Tax=Coraliomargarita algicola TaxID=3092156 RepID=A0ABZ0RJC2_9BACT|nr:prolyl oligopeptidase family serine peptidase [Coraliomargarita sp. J2-16]WPJ95183.1 prolyl oligopeptidase family serine peptidase [Coraliomargarita sp. J2-16]